MYTDGQVGSRIQGLFGVEHLSKGMFLTENQLVIRYGII